MGHPERFSPGRLSRARLVDVTDAWARSVLGGNAADVRKCLICNLPLLDGGRKVHRGGCERARKTQLQAARRRRARR